MEEMVKIAWFENIFLYSVSKRHYDELCHWFITMQCLVLATLTYGVRYSLRNKATNFVKEFIII